MKQTILSGLATLALLSGSAASAAEPNSEQIRVPLSDPSRPAHVEVSLVMGGITVVGGAGGEVVVEAIGRADDAQARPGWPTPPEPPEPPKAPGGDRSGMRRIPNTAFALEAEERDNRVSIASDSWRRALDLRITVPAGSSLELSTVNDGNLVVEGVAGELALHNTNGEIRVTGAKGPVSAATVNGDVRVAFEKSAAIAAPMAFSTLNGDIEVTLPAGLDAFFRMSTTNGEIYSDFDIEIERKIGPPESGREKGRYRVVIEREVGGRIGDGGPELMLKTFNGDILLKRAGG